MEVNSAKVGPSFSQGFSKQRQVIVVDDYNSTLGGRLDGCFGEHGIHLRIAHPSSPCAGALPAEPTLEEALMTRRYAVQEQSQGQAA